MNEAKNSLEANRIKKCGRKQKLSVRDKKMIVRNSQINPRLSASQLRLDCGAITQNVSRRTVNRVLTEAGLRSYRAVKRPLITEADRRKRFNWCRLYVSHN